MIPSGIEPATLRHVTQFYRNALFVNNGLLLDSTLFPPLLNTEVLPSVESFTNFMAVVRCAVGQRRYEVWRCSPTVTYRNLAKLKILVPS